MATRCGGGEARSADLTHEGRQWPAKETPCGPSCESMVIHPPSHKLLHPTHESDWTSPESIPQSTEPDTPITGPCSKLDTNILN